MRRSAFVQSVLSLSLIATSIGLATSALAEPGTTSEASSSSLSGEGTISIEQKNGSGAETIGKWTLIMPGNIQKAGQSSMQVIDHAQAGNYTMFLDMPDGATATIRIYRNGLQESLVEHQQASFKVTNGDDVRLVVHYTLTKVGLISIDSDPQGVTFTMTGPNNQDFEGTTPMSYDSVAEGQYGIKYGSFEGCVSPPPKGMQLIAGSRISFTVKFSCAKADELRAAQQANNTTSNTVSIVDSGDNVSLHDVGKGDWFAQYVLRVAKAGILSGYRDEAGMLTGEFGPGNSVTVGELAKIAHTLAGISIDAYQGKDPLNPSAIGLWFSSFVASAEGLGWTIYDDATIDATRPATRAEVVTTLLQSLDVPIKWQHGSMFTDVNVHTMHAAAIETAAADDVIQGRNDPDGNSLHQFAPNEPINRAEMAKVLSSMMDKYRKVSTNDVAR